MVSHAKTSALHRTKSHLILSPPELVGIIGILLTYIAEALTYHRVVPGSQILEEDPTYQAVL